MVNFSLRADVFLAEGHDHDEDEARTSLAATLSDDRRARIAEVHADQALLSEGYYSEVHGFGHDCSLHRDVPEDLWAPGCHDGGFRPVTVAAGIPDLSANKLERSAKPEGG